MYCPTGIEVPLTRRADNRARRPCAAATSCAGTCAACSQVVLAPGTWHQVVLAPGTRAACPHVAANSLHKRGGTLQVHDRPRMAGCSTVVCRKHLTIRHQCRRLGAPQGQQRACAKAPAAPLAAATLFKGKVGAAGASGLVWSHCWCARPMKSSPSRTRSAHGTASTQCSNQRSWAACGSKI